MGLDQPAIARLRELGFGRLRTYHSDPDTASPDAPGRFIVGADMIGQTRRFFTGMVSNPVLVPGVADQTQIGLMSGTQVVGLP